MGCTPSSVLRNPEPATVRNHTSHIQGNGEQKLDSVVSVRLRRPVVHPPRTSPDSSPAAVEVARTHHISTNLRNQGATAASEDTLLLSSMTSQALGTAAEAVPSLAQFGSKSSEPMLPDETSPPLNNAAEGAPSEPSSVAVGAVVPLVQVGMDLEMVASVTSHYNDSVTGGGTSMPLGGAVEVGGGSSSMQRRRDRDRQSLIRFEPHNPQSSTSLFGGNASCDSSASSPIGCQQQSFRRPFLRLTVAHQPSLGGGSVGSMDIRLTEGGDESQQQQQQPRRSADHNVRRRVEGRKRSGSSVKAEAGCMNPLLLDQLEGQPPHPVLLTTAPNTTSDMDPSQRHLLQSQQSLFGEGSTSAAWFMDDMSRLAITVKDTVSMATDDEEAVVWFDEHEGGAASTTAAVVTPE